MRIALAVHVAGALAGTASADRGHQLGPQFSGVVMVSRHRMPVFAHAYGLANRATGEPNTLATASTSRRS